MNDLEERLRADLLWAAEPIQGDVDTEELLSIAHRARDTRRTRRAVAVVALSLVGGLSLWVGASLSSLVSVPVIATPAPVPSVTQEPSPVRPTPSPTPTRSPRDWTGHSSSVTFDTSDLPDLAGVGLQTVTVAFRGAPGSDVVVSATRKTGKPISRSGVVTDASPFLAKLTDKVWVMVTPGEVRWAEGAIAGGITSANADQLDGLGVIVAVGEPELKLAGFIWQDAGGKVWNDRGVRVPSAQLELGDRTYWFAHDQELGVACSGEFSEGRTSGFPEECGYISTLGESGRGSSDVAGWEERLFVVVPKGATEVSVDASEQCTSASTALDPGGQVLVLLICTGPAGQPEAGFPVVRYRDAEGKAASYSP